MNKQCANCWVNQWAKNAWNSLASHTWHHLSLLIIRDSWCFVKATKARSDKASLLVLSASCAPLHSGIKSKVISDLGQGVVGLSPFDARYSLFITIQRISTNGRNWGFFNEMNPSHLKNDLKTQPWQNTKMLNLEQVVVDY